MYNNILRSTKIQDGTRVKYKGSADEEYYGLFVTDNHWYQDRNYTICLMDEASPLWHDAKTAKVVQGYISSQPSLPIDRILCFDSTIPTPFRLVKSLQNGRNLPRHAYIRCSHCQSITLKQYTFVCEDNEQHFNCQMHFVIWNEVQQCPDLKACTEFVTELKSKYPATPYPLVHALFGLKVNINKQKQTLHFQCSKASNYKVCFLCSSKKSLKHIDEELYFHKKYSKEVWTENSDPQIDNLLNNSRLDQIKLSKGQRVKFRSSFSTVGGCFLETLGTDTSKSYVFAMDTQVDSKGSQVMENLATKYGIDRRNIKIISLLSMEIVEPEETRSLESFFSLTPNALFMCETCKKVISKDLSIICKNCHVNCRNHVQREFSMSGRVDRKRKKNIHVICNVCNYATHISNIETMCHGQMPNFDIDEYVFEIDLLRHEYPIVNERIKFFSVGGLTLYEGTVFINNHEECVILCDQRVPKTTSPELNCRDQRIAQKLHLDSSFLLSFPKGLFLASHAYQSQPFSLTSYLENKNAKYACKHCCRATSQQDSIMCDNYHVICRQHVMPGRIPSIEEREAIQTIENILSQYSNVKHAKVKSLFMAKKLIQGHYRSGDDASLNALCSACLSVNELKFCPCCNCATKLASVEKQLGILSGEMMIQLPIRTQKFNILSPGTRLVVTLTSTENTLNQKKEVRLNCLLLVFHKQQRVLGRAIVYDDSVNNHPTESDITKARYYHIEPSRFQYLAPDEEFKLPYEVQQLNLQYFISLPHQAALYCSHCRTPVFRKNAFLCCQSHVFCREHRIPWPLEDQPTHYYSLLSLLKQYPGCSYIKARALLFAKEFEKLRSRAPEDMQLFLSDVCKVDRVVFCVFCKSLEKISDIASSFLALDSAESEHSAFSGKEDQIEKSLMEIGFQLEDIRKCRASVLMQFRNNVEILAAMLAEAVYSSQQQEEEHAELQHQQHHVLPPSSSQQISSSNDDKVVSDPLPDLNRSQEEVKVDVIVDMEVDVPPPVSNESKEEFKEEAMVGMEVDALDDQSQAQLSSENPPSYPDSIHDVKVRSLDEFISLPSGLRITIFGKADTFTGLFVHVPTGLCLSNEKGFGIIYDNPIVVKPDRDSKRLAKYYGLSSNYVDMFINLHLQEESCLTLVDQETYRTLGGNDRVLCAFCSYPEYKKFTLQCSSSGHIICLYHLFADSEDAIENKAILKVNSKLKQKYPKLPYAKFRSLYFGKRLINDVQVSAHALTADYVNDCCLKDCQSTCSIAILNELLDLTEEYEAEVEIKTEEVVEFKSNLWKEMSLSLIIGCRVQVVTTTKELIEGCFLKLTESEKQADLLVYCDHVQHKPVVLEEEDWNLFHEQYLCSPNNIVVIPLNNIIKIDEQILDHANFLKMPADTLILCQQCQRFVCRKDAFCCPKNHLVCKKHRIPWHQHQHQDLDNNVERELKNIENMYLQNFQDVHYLKTRALLMFNLWQMVDSQMRHQLLSQFGLKDSYSICWKCGELSSLHDILIMLRHKFDEVANNQTLSLLNEYGITDQIIIDDVREDLLEDELFYEGEFIAGLVQSKMSEASIKKEKNDDDKFAQASNVEHKQASPQHSQQPPSYQAPSHQVNVYVRNAYDATWKTVTLRSSMLERNLMVYELLRESGRQYVDVHDVDMYINSENDFYEKLEFNNGMNDQEDIANFIHERRIKIISMRDNVGVKQKMSTLISSFQFNHAMMVKLSNLSSKYDGWRSIRGDGNCYYRAFYVGLIEQIINSGEILRKEKFLLLSELMRISFENEREASLNQDLIGRFLSASEENCWKDVTEFEDDVIFNNNLDVSFIISLRKILSNFVIEFKNKSFNGLTLEELILSTYDVSSMEEYCVNYIEKLGEDAEGPLVDLGVLMKLLASDGCVVFLDRRENVELTYLKPSEILDTYLPKPAMCLGNVHLLLRPGHYDLLYAKEDDYDEAKGVLL